MSTEAYVERHFHRSVDARDYPSILNSTGHNAFDTKSYTQAALDLNLLSQTHEYTQ